MTTHKKKMQVQALDPETYHWVCATILEEGTAKSKLTWTGFSKKYDCWINNNNVRAPLEKRLIHRNAIQKINFPLRGDPKNLRRADKIFDTNRKLKFDVATNDPFEAKVRFIKEILLLGLPTFFIRSTLFFVFSTKIVSVSINLQII